jgi:hypothetical protein
MYLNQLFNAVLLKGYFPAKRKVILSLMPGKHNELLPSMLLTKVSEKLLKRLLPVVQI